MEEARVAPAVAGPPSAVSTWVLDAFRRTLRTSLDGADPTTALAAVCRRIEQLTGAPGGAVIVAPPDAPPDDAVVVAGSGILATCQGQRGVAPPGSVIASALEHGEPVLARRLDPDTDHVLVAAGVAAALCVPVVGTRDRTVGAILLGDRVSNPWSAVDVDVLGLFAVLVAAVVEHDRVVTASTGLLLDRELAEERRATLIDMAPGAMFELDGFGCVQSWNRAAERLFGWREDELLGQPLPLVGRGTQELRAQVGRALIGETSAVRFAARRRSGAPISIEARMQPLRVRGRVVGVIGSVVDLTGDVVRDGVARQAQRLETVGRMAAGIVHDVNNLLTAVAGYADLARDELDPDHPVRRDLAEIGRAVARGAALTQRILGFVRQQPSEPEIVDPVLAMAGVDLLLRRTLPGATPLVLEVNACRPVRLRRGELEQVVMNLVLNARDATPDGGPITVAVSDLPTGWLRLEVTDVGIGMSPDLVERIFEPGYTTKSESEGSGIGLATVQEIVTGAGGKIEVLTTPGQGTTFRVELPVAPGYDEAPVAVPPGVVDVGLTGGRVLVVERDPVVAHLVRSVLEADGYEVVAALRPDDLSQSDLVWPEPVRLVLGPPTAGDPDMARLVRQLRTVAPQARVLSMSGAAALGDRDDEGHPVLPKPFTALELRAAIHALIADQPAGS